MSLSKKQKKLIVAKVAQAVRKQILELKETKYLGEEIAEKAGTSPSRISDLISGRYFTEKTLAKLIKAKLIHFQTLKTDSGVSNQEIRFIKNLKNLGF